MRWQRTGALALLAATLGACGLVEPDACDVCTTSAVVYGVVRDTSGAPVAGAGVQVEAYYADSARGPATLLVGATSGSVQTDAEGRYTARPSAPAAPFRAALVVRVTPPESTGLITHVVLGQQVDFRADHRGAERDRVRVDVIMYRLVSPSIAGGPTNER